MSANPPTLGAEMLAALRHGFATVREGMTNPDIRIALPTPPRSIPGGGKPLTSFLGSAKPTPPPIRSASSG